MRNFKNLEIWKQGIEIVKQTYIISSKLPQSEKFGLQSQIQRAAVSIPSNIAEGASRNSDIEYKRFLEIAMGSLFELETQLVILQKLNYCKSEDLKSIIDLLQKEAKMINAFITKLKTKS